MNWYTSKASFVTGNLLKIESLGTDDTNFRYTLQNKLLPLLEFFE